MKKVLSLMLGIAAMFTSCSQHEELIAKNNSANQVTFTLTANNGVQTRATGTLRYVMAIYDKTSGTNVIGAIESGSGSFAVRLDPGEYTCLFWADYGSANYNTTDLKNVALQDAATEVEAFYAKKDITVTNAGTENVTLGRAVAKVVLKETDWLDTGTITVNYDGFKGFDVSQGAGINETTLTKTFSITSEITGSTATPTEVGNFLLLAQPNERYLTNFKVQYNSETEKTISNVPVQANYVTNIKGKFSVNVGLTFSITIDDTWNGTNKDVNI